jgi:hypothetical protein
MYLDGYIYIENFGTLQVFNRSMQQPVALRAWFMIMTIDRDIIEGIMGL